jgi:Domain of Unknown Function with PDB structure (DUF3857)/Transglutaminase-like superfamily
MDQRGETVREITPGARVAPPAAWVDLAPYAIPETANPHFIAQGLCVLLDDSQIDLCGNERAWFYRRAEIVTAAAGAERAAQFSVSFDPAFETLDVHSVAVIRNGQRIEHADAGFFEVLRRERNMERLQFDGRLTIAMTMPDVRQGDVVESCYTLTGMRRSLGGRHALWIPFEWSVGIVETRLRQRAPKQRAIAERGFGDAPVAVETESDGVIDRRWTTSERPGVKFEALAPPWSFQTAVMQFSEWTDWSDVVAAFAPLYEDTSALSGEFEAEIARIAASEATEHGRAAAVLRFTQSAVRYLAISIGEGGYTPRQLADICATRYGDCKDKTKLYVAMARRLGLDACPALVNTRDGPALNDWLPSAQVFDHCIVRLQVDGRSYWLDPTLHEQTAGIDRLSQSRYGWALPLHAEARALEHMGDEPHEHTLDCIEIVTVGASSKDPVLYEWRVTMRGWRAENLRARFAREGEVGLFKLYADDLMRTYPHARVSKQEILNDDHAANAITTVESFEIADAWTPLSGPGERVGFGTLDLFLRQTLAKLDPGPRKLPIDLGHVGKVTRRIEINTPTPWVVNPIARRLEGSALSFAFEVRKLSSRQFEVLQSLDIRAWLLPASEAPLYRDIVAELEKGDIELTSEIDKRGRFKRGPEPGEPLGVFDMVRWALIGGFVIFWIALFAGA